MGDGSTSPLAEQAAPLRDRAVPNRQRTRLSNEGVKHFVRDTGNVTLRTQLAGGAKVRAERDLEVAEEWFARPE